MSPATVLLIDPSARTAAAIQAALQAAGYAVLHTPAGKQGLILAWRDLPDAILLDLDLPDIDSLEVIRKLRRDPRTANRPILGMILPDQPQRRAEAVQAGMNGCVLKQSDAAEHLLLLLRGEKPATGPLLRPSTRPLGGARIAVLSPSAAVGATTFCLNLTSDLALHAPEHSCVAVELTPPPGSFSAVLGHYTEGHLLRLARLKDPQLAPDPLRDLVPYSRTWGVHWIPAAPTPVDTSTLAADWLARFLQALERAFALVVLDIGRNLSSANLAAARQARAILVLFSPDAESVEKCQALMRFLQLEEIPAQRVVLVSNAVSTHPALTPEAIERALGHVPAGALPDAGPTLRESNRDHLPLTRRHVQNPWAQALQAFSRELLQRLRAPHGHLL